MSPQYNNERVSFRNGYWFYFNDQGTPITAFGSAISGKEKVFIGDELVSERLSWRFTSSHHFNHDGADYELAFKTTNWLTGELVCSLTKNGVLLDTATKAYTVKSGRSFWKDLLISMLFGGIVGFCAVWGFHAGKNYFGG
jgi:hypothetical protein